MAKRKIVDGESPKDEGAGIEGVLLSRRIGSDSPVKCVAIVGGTHGNERHGVHMVKHYLKEPSAVQRSTFKTMCLLGNPAAVENKVLLLAQKSTLRFSA